MQRFGSWVANEKLNFCVIIFLMLNYITIIYNYIILNHIKITFFLRRKKLFSTWTWKPLCRWLCFYGDFFPGYRFRLHCLNAILETLMCSCIRVSSFQKSSQEVRNRLSGKTMSSVFTSCWQQALESIRQGAHSGNLSLNQIVFHHSNCPDGAVWGQWS